MKASILNKEALKKILWGTRTDTGDHIQALLEDPRLTKTDLNGILNKIHHSKIYLSC